jgi:hypothetical protein
MFEQEMKDIVTIFSKKEGEETWESINTSFLRLNKWILEDDITEYTSFIKYIEQLKEPIKNAVSLFFRERNSQIIYFIA